MPQPTVTKQAARALGHPRLDAPERVRELVARGEERHAVVPHHETTGDDLVVDRRHDDLDAVVDGDAIADVEMLLEERRLRDSRLGRRDAVEQRRNEALAATAPARLTNVRRVKGSDPSGRGGAVAIKVLVPRASSEKLPGLDSNQQGWGRERLRFWALVSAVRAAALEERIPGTILPGIRCEPLEPAVLLLGVDRIEHSSGHAVASRQTGGRRGRCPTSNGQGRPSRVAIRLSGVVTTNAMVEFRSRPSAFMSSSAPTSPFFDRRRYSTSLAKRVVSPSSRASVAHVVSSYPARGSGSMRARDPRVQPAPQLRRRSSPEPSSARSSVSSIRFNLSRLCSFTGMNQTL